MEQMDFGNSEKGFKLCQSPIHKCSRLLASHPQDLKLQHIIDFGVLLYKLLLINRPNHHKLIFRQLCT